MLADGALELCVGPVGHEGLCRPVVHLGAGGFMALLMLVNYKNSLRLY